MSREKNRVTVFETFGINNPSSVLQDAARAVFGKSDVQPTEYDLTSTRVFKPQISIPTWLGIKRGRRVPIYNFFNRDLKPLDTAYSVKVTQVRDYRGGEWTYNSHMGTDFAIPVGTHITTVAPGKVIHVGDQFDHGGLKLFLDHGNGLITTYGHLSRSLVKKGDVVARGDSIALSGAAGIELLIFFPWVAPHLHLNVVLNGNPVDPFGIDSEGEVPMWLNGNDPIPHLGAPDSAFEPSQWNKELIDNAIDYCTEPEEQERLRAIDDIDERAAELLNDRMFYGTIFTDTPPLYETEYERKPCLDLPFRAKDFDGVEFPS